jgi:hypothetical protein
MFKITRQTLATVALLSGIAAAIAQEAPTTTPAVPMPSPGGAVGTMPMTDMGGMMDDGMRQMMPMMRMMQGAMMQGAGGMGMMPFDHIEGRIAFYKTELGITDAQLPQWNAFADALRNGAKGMRMAMAVAMQAGMPANAPARLDAMVQIMSARLDAMKAMATTGRALYAVFTDAQKKIADDLMMSSMGRM